MTNHEFGIIQSVDTGTVTVHIEDEKTLDNLQVNQLLTISSPYARQSIIAIINKIMRHAIEVADDDNNGVQVENIVKAQLIGTWYVKHGVEDNVFKRSLEVVPNIGSKVSLLENDKLKEFMGSISSKNKIS